MNTKIFIVGKSKTGKTPLSLFLSEKTGFKYISASEYVKKMFNKEHIREKDRDKYIKEITNFSLNILKENIKANNIVFKENKNYIVDSIRNPFDFTRYYNNKSDYVIFMNKEGIIGNKFEKGVDIIEDICDWLIENELVNNDKIIKVNYRDYIELETIKKNIYDRICASIF